MIGWRMILATVLFATPSLTLGAAGDVSFRIADRAWHVSQGGQALTVDVMVDVDSQASVPAIGWGMVVTITPQPGASGTVEFAPTAIVGNLPNLSPASISPYRDFDLDENGKSYGELASTAGQLHAFSAYIEPALGPSPAVDGNGNLSLPSGSGLASLPISLSAGASGQFLIDFVADPRVTGVVYATGLAVPDDVAVHPAAAHIAGLLSIVGTAGDYNADGAVNLADYAVWRDSVGSMGVGLLADGSGNGVVGPEDYSIWKDHFGDAVGPAALSLGIIPEPAPHWAVLIAIGFFVALRRR